MMNKEYDEEMDEMEMEGGWMGCMGRIHHWPKKAKKEFLMALLRKREKMLEAQLAFVREMKDMAEKMAEEMKEMEEKK
jgi:hypothetical protein